MIVKVADPDLELRKRRGGFVLLALWFFFLLLSLVLTKITGVSNLPPPGPSPDYETRALHSGGSRP